MEPLTGCGGAGRQLPSLELRLHCLQSEQHLLQSLCRTRLPPRAAVLAAVANLGLSEAAKGKRLTACLWRRLPVVSPSGKVVKRSKIMYVVLMAMEFTAINEKGRSPQKIYRLVPGILRLSTPLCRLLLLLRSPCKNKQTKKNIYIAVQSKRQ